jgi:hypothetical protein
MRGVVETPGSSPSHKGESRRGLTLGLGVAEGAAAVVIAPALKLREEVGEGSQLVGRLNAGTHVLVNRVERSPDSAALRAEVSAIKQSDDGISRSKVRQGWVTAVKADGQALLQQQATPFEQHLRRVEKRQLAQAVQARGGPAELAQYHDELLRWHSEMAAVRCMSPGPGAYEPRENKQGTLEGHAHVFRSGSQRLKEVVECTGDPGAYDPRVGVAHDTASSRSFSRSSRAGAGGFNAVGARDLRLEIVGEDTPGPGSYNGRAYTIEQGRRDALSAGLSASNKSASAQHPPAVVRERLKTPGPGSYDPKPVELQPPGSNAGASLRSKHVRNSGFGSYGFIPARDASDPGAWCKRAAGRPRPICLGPCVYYS